MKGHYSEVLWAAGYTSPLLRSTLLASIPKWDYHQYIVAIAYQLGIVYIKFVGTHADYDNICAETIDME